MSRGAGRGRGWTAGRGGRGGGRGGAGGPISLSFSELKELREMSREQSALYPPMDPIPTMKQPTDAESRAVQAQLEVVVRLKRSAYWVVEPVAASDELERYSDRYRPTAATRPPLKAVDLCQEFFPASLWDAYFAPAKRRKLEVRKPKLREKMNLASLEDDEAKGKDPNALEDDQDRDQDGPEQADYDEADEDGNDYEDEYFDNGEGEDDDVLGADEDGGGGGDYD